MSFTTLMYHELREGEGVTFNENHLSQIDVKQDYIDILPSPLFIKKKVLKNIWLIYTIIIITF